MGYITTKTNKKNTWIKSEIYRERNHKEDANGNSGAEKFNE